LRNSGCPRSRLCKTLAHHPNLDQLRQRIIASHHLEALDAEELEDYVHHRLAHVGWEHQPSLEKGLLPALYEATGGIPRRVNQIMNRLLLLGAIEERDEIALTMLEAVLEEMQDDQLRGSAARSTQPASEPVEEASEVLELGPVSPEPAVELDIPAEPLAPEEAAEIESVPATEVAAMMAARDARAAELEAAIGELQAAGARPAEVDMPSLPADEDVTEALGRIEARLEEQERSFRHVLTMLIEWLEDDRSREAA
ncbi:MAG: hypothetical protein AAFY42_06405, partial [Pseudomonadota bacterium]